jgi:hypothetical protein
MLRSNIGLAGILHELCRLRRALRVARRPAGEAMELDHVFVLTRVGAPAAARLIEFGLTEGSSNVHPGQGTSNRRFFFQNAMLELLWVHDPAEACIPRPCATRLWERGTLPGSSPFGVCFRPASGEQAAVPFPAWKYQPLYLPESLVIEVGAETPLSEPMWFYLAFGLRPDEAPAGRREPLEHRAGFREITGLRIHCPADQAISDPARAADSTAIVSVVRGVDHLLEIEFDGAAQGLDAEFRPELPLVLRW